MNARVITSIVLLGLGAIIAAVPKNKTLQFRVSAEEMVTQLNGRSQYIGPDEIADMIVSGDPTLQLIDLRSAEEYQKFHLPGAINIPMSELINPEYRYYIDQDLKLNVFYSNGTVTSNEAWIVTRQLGYKNNYVLEGGLNYWAETIMNPEKPASTSPNEEIAKYDFRMGASAALGGGSLEVSTPSTSSVDLPAIQKRPPKKKASGGC